MTEKFSEGNVDTGKQAGTPQVDNFSKELSDFLSDEKLTNKEQISNFLISNSDFKNGFEDFLKTANLRQKIKCKKELQNCSTEEKIKSIILENIPEGYKVGNNEVGNREVTETTVEDEDFINLTEQARTDREQARTDREQARTDREQARTDREQVEDNKKKMERAMKIARVARQDLLNNHPKGKEIDEKTRKEAEKFKKELPEETKKQLEEKGYDENFINDYILLRVTLNEVKGDSSFDRNQVEQFEKSVNELSALDIILKNIDNACNISDTNLSSFSSENISQTRTELFNKDVGNKSLIEARDNNKDHHDYSEIFPEMGEDDMFIKYGQFLEGNLKNYWNQYKDDYLGFMNHLNELREQASKGKVLNQEEKDFLSLPGIIKGIKEKMDNDTKNMVEELCIISQIKGMYMCMGEGADFDLNKANEIQNENGILTLNGHIDGVDFAIRQDTNNPEARLQTSQKLAKSTDGNVFSIGGKDNFIDSNFILPSQNEIFESIAATVQSDKSFSESQDQSEYLENLQTNIMGKMEEKFKDTEYVHHYMQGEIGGEKVINETLTLITEKSPSIINNETLMKNISQDTNKDLFDFIKILKFNIDNSTNTEKNHLNQCITKILEITNNYANSNGTESSASFKYPPIIENYLKNESWLNGGNENSRLSSLSDLFKYYSENSKDARSNVEGNNGAHSKMIINDLYRDLFESSSGESLVSQARTTKIENESADNYLASAIEDFPSSPETPSIA